MEFLTLIMVALLGYQVSMPAVDNGRYTFNIDPRDGTVIVMNTQTGEMRRCTQDLQCSPFTQPKKSTD